MAVPSELASAIKINKIKSNKQVNVSTSTKTDTTLAQKTVSKAQ